MARCCGSVARSSVAYVLCFLHCLNGFAFRATNPINSTGLGQEEHHLIGRCQTSVRGFFMLKNHARFAAVTASVVGVTMAVGGAPASSASAGSIPYGGTSATASRFGVSSAVAASLQRPGTYVTMSKSN